MSAPRLTVIVPVFNGAHVLDRTVPSMMAERLPAEWVFVDDGSTDDTPAVLERLLHSHAPPSGGVVRVVRHAANQGRWPARATGIAASCGEVLVFLDCDVAPDPGALQELIAPLAEGVAVACVGQVRTATPDPGEPLHAYLDRYPRGAAAAARSNPGPTPWHHFLLGLAAIRRDVLRAAMDVPLVVSYGEDLELGARVRRRHPDGLWFVPRARARIFDTGTLSTHLAKVEAFGREGAPVLWDRYPELRRPLRAHLMGPAAPLWAQFAARVMASSAARDVLQGALRLAPRALWPSIVRALLAGAYARGTLAGYPVFR